MDCLKNSANWVYVPWPQVKTLENIELQPNENFIKFIDHAKILYYDYDEDETSFERESYLTVLITTSICKTIAKFCYTDRNQIQFNSNLFHLDKYTVNIIKKIYIYI